MFSALFRADRWVLRVQSSFQEEEGEPLVLCAVLSVEIFGVLASSISPHTAGGFTAEGSCGNEALRAVYSPGDDF